VRKKFFKKEQKNFIKTLESQKWSDYNKSERSKLVKLSRWSLTKISWH